MSPGVGAQSASATLTHDHGGQEHGHSHGLIDPSIKRSRDGIRVVLVSLALLAVTAAIQAAISARRTANQAARMLR